MPSAAQAGLKPGIILVCREKNRPDKCAKAADMMRKRSLSLEALCWQDTEPPPAEVIFAPPPPPHPPNNPNSFPRTPPHATQCTAAIAGRWTAGCQSLMLALAWSSCAGRTRTPRLLR